ncbi:uncharacterized protein KD926_008229 [Aspergillus affinis]|uniref:uncharacterized protein n=1 Tax=Aspergillus affinis TaxID=1070780 RepID=UPI0022FEC25C|nr:uncharacterized protein KD926_008229 [Aspergillus affinis]KAI9040524.1 hypothetical protein KD926_008229 [Aspergillus affinis]
MSQLKRKRVSWKQQMLESLKASRQKLNKYYSQTDRIRGHIYAIGTMLVPDSRFQFFLSDDWDPQWRNTYQKTFQAALIPYQERLSSGQNSQNPQVQIKPSLRLNKMLNGNKISAKPVGDKVTQYLDSEASQLEQFFTLEEIEAVREQNHKNLEEIEIDVISDDDKEEEVEEVSPGLISIDSELQLPETTTQLRVPGRKRKSRADDDFEQY